MINRRLAATALVLLVLLAPVFPTPAQDKPAATATTEPAPPRTPERFLAVAEKLVATGKYDPKNGSTYCNWFARDFAKELLGQALPELTGQANDQLTKLATSPDWEKGILVYTPTAAG